MSQPSASRLARILTPTYASLVNAQIVHPSASQVVKPNELASALMRPLQTSAYEPHRSPAYLAATLSFGIIKGHPFLDGNKRTAFFLANEYLRLHGMPRMVEERGIGQQYENLMKLAERHVGVAAGQAEIDTLA